MLTGRSTLGKIVLLVFIGFNVVMLALTGIAYNLKETPAEEIREQIRDKIIELGKEARDDRKLDDKDMADIDEAVDDIMGLVVFAQEKGLQGILILWGFGAGIFSVLLYFTRPQPI